MDFFGDKEVFFLMILVCVLVVFLLGWMISVFINLPKFTEEMNRIDIEIGRTSGNERKHYVKKKHRLWLSLLPFVKYK